VARSSPQAQARIARVLALEGGRASGNIMRKLTRMTAMVAIGFAAEFAVFTVVNHYSKSRSARLGCIVGHSITYEGPTPPDAMGRMIRQATPVLSAWHPDQTLRARLDPLRRRYLRAAFQ
jgi:hypothetical protein